MPTIVDKEATVELLRGAFTALGQLGSELSDSQWMTATCLPGWTVRDVVAHIIGTESMLCGDPTPDVDISHLHHMNNPIAESNESWVESMRPLSTADLMARYESVTTRRLLALAAMSQSDFDAPSWTPAGKDETYGRFMRIRHYDTYLHELDIRYAVGALRRHAEADMQSSLDEVATGLGYIVGRKAGLPDGSRVRIDLTGEVTRSFLVRIDGRAAVVETLDGEPNVDVRMPAGLFLRLTGGRRDDGAPLDEIRYRGDELLGRQLVANLAFTI
jgi:uncharacterized protein (TIGR03083 family)